MGWCYSYFIAFGGLCESYEDLYHLRIIFKIFFTFKDFIPQGINPVQYI